MLYITNLPGNNEFFYFGEECSEPEQPTNREFSYTEDDLDSTTEHVDEWDVDHPDHKYKYPEQYYPQ